MAANKRTFGEDITNRISQEGKSINAQGGAAIIHPNLLHPLNMHAQEMSHGYQGGDKGNKSFDGFSHQVRDLRYSIF